MTPTNDFNLLVIHKGADHYIFFYSDENRLEALRAFGRHAVNPDLNFTWYDAAVLTMEIREQTGTGTFR